MREKTIDVYRRSNTVTIIRQHIICDNIKEFPVGNEKKKKKYVPNDCEALQ